MKRNLLSIAGILAAALLASALFGADTEINLVQQSDFKPVMMHGKPTAAFGSPLFLPANAGAKTSPPGSVRRRAV